MARLAVVAVLVCAALSVSTAALGVPDKDRVKGTVAAQDISGFPLAFHINAKGGSDGNEAKGSFSEVVDRSGFGLGVLEFRGDVSCLVIDGNHAAAKGVVNVSTHPLVPVGSEIEIHVEDNGDPGAGADKWSTGFWLGPQDGCPEIAEEVFGPTAFQGDLIVKDN